MVNVMGMEFFIMLMDQNTKVNGLKIKNMELHYSLTKMG